MVTRAFVWIRMVCVLGLFMTGMGAMPAEASQAQCRPRSDWGTYVVVRGDTLSRIARRFATSVSALTTGNCLVNANRIYVGQRLRVPTGGGGNPAPAPVPAVRDQIVPVTYQAYQSGFMLWRADTGEIWAYIGGYGAGGSGELQVYSSAQYGRLAVQPVTAPAGLVAPIMGFNRVWSNLGDLRRRLGWAVNTELSYTPWLHIVGNTVTSFTLPGGQVASGSGSSWQITGYDPNRPFPPAPVEPVSRILAFTAPPGPLQVGDTLTVTWKVEGTQYALLTILDGDANVVVRSWESLPTEGSVSMVVPTILTSELHVTLQAADLAATTPTKQWTTRASASLTISVLPRSTSVTTQAAYQPYGQGLMVWRQDTGTIYVFGLGLGYYPQSSYEGLPDNVCTDLAPGVICPINGFGRIWGNEPYIRRTLGWPTAGEQAYTATIVSRGIQLVSITLPDGRKVLIDDGWNWHF